MQLGFNTNFRYREVVFHVQTEDSGRANPHVITHIFHGGNIIASLKSDYSALLVEADLETAVRKLMETQHKSMLKQLSRGQFDGAIGERLGPDIFLAEPGAEGDREPEQPPSVDRAGRSRGRGDFESGSSSSDRTPGIAARSASPSPAASRAAAEPTVASPPGRETTSGLARVFGDRVVSEKPLDEVVLDYLVENARKRKRQPKP